MIERTLAIIKPDATAKRLAGKIIDRIEQEGFNIIGMQKLQLTRDQAEYFYEVHQEQRFFSELINFIISGPVIIMVLEEEDAIAAWRELMGTTDPNKAAAGTLRKLYGSSIGENATHGSDSPETAHREVSFFFPDLTAA